VNTTEPKSTSANGEPASKAMTPSTTHTAETTSRHERQRRAMRPFDAMLADMDRFFPDPSAWFPIARLRRGLGAVQMPRVDVVEKDKTLVVTAELPGVKKEDVHVEMDDGTLIIRGETRSEHEDKDRDYVRMERTYGSFYRRLPLGFNGERSQISATLKDGVLEVRIPEPSESKDKNEAEIPIT
jgi:HSP20 family protein